MDFRKFADSLSTREIAERENDPAAQRAAEIRLLNDLELVLAGGGDPVPQWP